MRGEDPITHPMLLGLVKVSEGLNLRDLTVTGTLVQPRQITQGNIKLLQCQR